jgi:hypothetical protein
MTLTQHVAWLLEKGGFQHWMPLYEERRGGHAWSNQAPYSANGDRKTAKIAKSRAQKASRPAAPKSNWMAKNHAQPQSIYAPNMNKHTQIDSMIATTLGPVSSHV